MGAYAHVYIVHRIVISSIYTRRKTWSTRIHVLNTYLNTPRSRSDTIADAKTGPEFLERRRRQAFGHDVGKLLGGGNVQNTNMAKSHLIPNKMDIKLNVLGVTMMNLVGGEVDGGDIVAVDDRGLLQDTRAREEADEARSTQQQC